MTNLNANCKECRERLPDLLLDPASVPVAIEAHVSACADCREELTSLRETFAALDEWTAPEPSAYFDTRLHARLREAQAAQPEGLFERVRSYLLFSTGRQLRPAIAGALALALVISGGSFVGVHGLHGTSSVHASTSATVNDLNLLDNNAQALQQMDQLLDDNDDQDPPPAT
jgi:predicted anti-sigma-YlaC factor YlaD